MNLGILQCQKNSKKLAELKNSRVVGLEFSVFQFGCQIVLCTGPKPMKTGKVKVKKGWPTFKKKS